MCARCDTGSRTNTRTSQAFYKQGNAPKRSNRLNAYLTQHPKDARARFLKGVILTEQNRTEDAIAVFTALTEDFPELPEPYNNLAVLYAEQGNYDKAREALEMAIRTHPSYAIAHENLGDIYATLASQAYDKALQLDGRNATAGKKLALIRELFSIKAAAGEVVPKLEYRRRPRWRRRLHRWRRAAGRTAEASAARASRRHAVGPGRHTHRAARAARDGSRRVGTIGTAGRSRDRRSHSSRAENGRGLDQSWSSNDATAYLCVLRTRFPPARGRAAGAVGSGAPGAAGEGRSHQRDRRVARK